MYIYKDKNNYINIYKSFYSLKKNRIKVKNGLCGIAKVDNDYIKIYYSKTVNIPDCYQGNFKVKKLKNKNGKRYSTFENLWNELTK